MEKAAVMVLASLKKVKTRGFDKWKKENWEEGTQSNFPQASHLFLLQKEVVSNDAL